MCPCLEILEELRQASESGEPILEGTVVGTRLAAWVLLPLKVQHIFIIIPYSVLWLYVDLSSLYGVLQCINKNYSVY